MRLFPLFLALSAFAADKPTDSDKLKIRDAQLARVSIAAQISQVEIQYTQLRTALEKAQAAEAKALADLGKNLGCEIDPQMVECKVAVK